MHRTPALAGCCEPAGAQAGIRIISNTRKGNCYLPSVTAWRFRLIILCKQLVSNESQASTKHNFFPWPYASPTQISLLVCKQTDWKSVAYPERRARSASEHCGSELERGEDDLTCETLALCVTSRTIVLSSGMQTNQPFGALANPLCANKPKLSIEIFGKGSIVYYLTPFTKKLTGTS